MQKLKKLLQTKFIKNAGWIVVGKVMQMILSFVIMTITARYLGPSDYGIINYVESYIAFFTSLCTLGLESIIVKELVQHEDQQGAVLGTVITLQTISSVLSAVALAAFVSLVNGGDKSYTIIAALYGSSLIFKSFETLQYWYQAKLMSRVYAIASLIAYAVMSMYRVFLLISNKSAEWFAFSVTVDAIVLSVALLLSYKRGSGPRFVVSWDLGRKMLSRSRHFIISGLMISIYWQFDKIMIRHMVGEVGVGCYSIASRICSIWGFVLVAVIDSARPVLFELIQKNQTEEFEKRLRILYSFIIYVSVGVSVVFTAFAAKIVTLLYGKAYLPGANILRVLTWGTAFSYLGTARNIWTLSTGYERYEKHMALAGTICNVLLNLLLIPVMGELGAAVATLTTQIFVNYLVMFMIKPLRRNGVLITKAFAISGLKSIGH